ncbi:hypothetical protein BC829DRAFT_84296 [Chytridium lagenaria]|nr:hypothetical protein BC829DRAFT_84296 [Chytridium lagenaria]
MSVLDLPSVHGVGVLGSLFSFHPISKRLYKDFVALVELLSKFPNVKSLLGNDPLKYRSRQYQSAGVIDGDFVSSIWRLTRHEKETFVRLWTENGMKLDILQKLLKFCDPSYL